MELSYIEVFSASFLVFVTIVMFLQYYLVRFKKMTYILSSFNSKIDDVELASKYGSRVILILTVEWIIVIAIPFLLVIFDIYREYVLNFTKIGMTVFALSAIGLTIWMQEMMRKKGSE